MTRINKALALALAAALLALAAFASVANAAEARSFSMSPAGAIESPSIGKLRFEAGGRIVECNVTLNGRMRRREGAREEREIVINGGTMGEINEVRTANCAGGSIERILIEARSPWIVTSTAVLPAGAEPRAITGGLFTIRATKFQFALFGGIARCLYEGDAGALTPLTATRAGETSYTTGNVRALTTSRYRLVSGFGCPSEGRMEGEFRLSTQTLTAR